MRKIKKIPTAIINRTEGRAILLNKAMMSKTIVANTMADDIVVVKNKQSLHCYLEQVAGDLLNNQLPCLCKTKCQKTNGKDKQHD